MNHQFGRSALRLYPKSLPISCRVSSGPVLFQRVSVAYYTKSGLYNLSTREQSNSSPQINLRRDFATKPVSRPKAHTGRTTKSPRKKKSDVTVSIGEGSTEKVTVKAKKPKAAPKAKAESKAKAKPKPKPKPKAKAKAKAKTTRKVVRRKKDTSEEGLAKAAEAKKNLRIRNLKKAALRPPTTKPSSAFTVINAEISKDAHGLSAKAASEKYKNLIPEELEHYNRIANENKQANEQAYRAWIVSFPPDEIRKANLARHMLKRLGVKGYNRRLQDERQVKRPVTAQNMFMKQRYSTGDMHGMALTDATRLIMREWKELPETEKQAFYDEQARSRERYSKEFEEVYNRPKPPPKARSPPAAAAAA